MLCPCYSKKDYRNCCKPYHDQKKVAEDPQALMRSRYSAYSQGLASYIIETTHSQNVAYRSDKMSWSQEIVAFSRQTEFRGLKIIDYKYNREKGEVTFIAELYQNGKDVSFKEVSQFEKEKGQWKYLSGELFKA